MATIPYKEIVSSSTFKFQVGPDKKEYTIHSSLISHQSKALHALVSGDLKEAREQCAIWEDFDEETFIRFSQFVYTGSYDESVPQKRKREQEATGLANTEEPVDEVTAVPSLKTGIKKRLVYNLSPPDISKAETLWNKFCLLYSEPLNIEDASDNSPGDDYTDVFLSHARVYVFADYHGISTLQYVALCKLRQALVRYTLHQEGTRDIIQLVDYCFSNTVAHKGGRCDDLRTLICIYVACRMKVLWKNDEFKELVDKLDEFPSALLTELMHLIE